MSTAVQSSKPPAIPPRPKSRLPFPSPAPGQKPAAAPTENTKRDSLYTFLDDSSVKSERLKDVVQPRQSCFVLPLRPNPISREASAASCKEDDNYSLYREPSIDLSRYQTNGASQPPTKIDASRTSDTPGLHGPPLDSDKTLGHSFDAEAALADFMQPRARRSAMDGSRKPVPSYPRPQTPYAPATVNDRPDSSYQPSKDILKPGLAPEPEWRSARLSAQPPAVDASKQDAEQTAKPATLAPPMPVYIHEGKQVRPAEEMTIPYPEHYPPPPPANIDQPQPEPTMSGALPVSQEKMQQMQAMGAQDIESQRKNSQRGFCGMPLWVLVLLLALMASLGLIIFIIRMMQDFNSPDAN